MTPLFVFLAVLFQKKTVLWRNAGHPPEFSPGDVPLRRLMFPAINEKLIDFFTHSSYRDDLLDSAFADLCHHGVTEQKALPEPEPVSV